jgi:hypothetical protein
LTFLISISDTAKKEKEKPYFFFISYKERENDKRMFDSFRMSEFFSVVSMWGRGFDTGKCDRYLLI